jgi:hypothetical protein
MLPRVVIMCVALLVLVGWAAAADETTVKGKIKSVSVEKKTVVVVTEDKKEIEVVFKDDGPPYLFGPNNGKVTKGLKDERMVPDWEVTLYFEKKDGKDVCTKFQLGKKK